MKLRPLICQMHKDIFIPHVMISFNNLSLYNADYFTYYYCFKLSRVHILPGYQIVLPVVYLSFGQVSNRHRVSKAHMHAAVILLQNRPGLQQTLQITARAQHQVHSFIF